MRIAIIGTGIAGNAAAYALATSTSHRSPSMSATSGSADIPRRSTSTMTARRIAVDTGFIVYNEMNYPNLTALFAHLGVETQASEMSFAVSARNGGFEWCGRTHKVCDGLFAQRRNLCLARLPLDAPRDPALSTAVAVEDRAAGVLAASRSDNYLHLRGFSRPLPGRLPHPDGRGDLVDVAELDAGFFPAESFIAFFQNHHLLQWNRPVWRTVKGGSRRYVETLRRATATVCRLGARCHQHRALGDRRRRHRRHRRDGALRPGGHRGPLRPDARHAGRSDPDETAVLGSIGYRDNEVYLHRDTALMPRAPARLGRLERACRARIPPRTCASPTG